MLGPAPTREGAVIVASSLGTQGVRSRRPRGRQADGRRRVVIDAIRPCIDGGRFPIKRVEGEAVHVEADLLCDGHDLVGGVVRHRRAGERAWTETRMETLGNDLYRGTFHVGAPGREEYSVAAYIDRFGSWRRDLGARLGAGRDSTGNLGGVAGLVAAAARRARGADRRALTAWAKRLRAAEDPAIGLDDDLAELARHYPDRTLGTDDAPVLPIEVDRERARFSTWYELFPRSCSPEHGRHGTLRDVEAWLPYVTGMGFDVLYLPPVHPIGTSHRKGPNNTPKSGPSDPGSPWAIGSAEGGHTAVHPSLGTLADFDHLVAAARKHGLEVAMDLAFQCSPDHPWVTEHPAWFRHRPDGSVQYAENPPKKYQDIYPIDFESGDWAALWQELRAVTEFWIDRGIRIFRVDNPHTKAFAFWQWLIAGIRDGHPDMIFLAEAFTRPKAMRRLAKLGFTQSYTYFTWRTTAWELREYMTELTQTDMAEYFRPNFWPNTPDILTEYLQTGRRGAFAARVVLAATLAASYGVYGPAFELGEHRPLRPGSEEYLDSEKYELRHWDVDRPDSLAPLMSRVNAIRRTHPALQANAGLRFHGTSNDQLLCYSKTDETGEDLVVMVVSLDPWHTQSGFVDLPVTDWGLDPDARYAVHDLLGDARYVWQGPRNYVELDPDGVPAHVLEVQRRLRTERDFETFA
jgi:starch synthase (maltosyl-transferring)